MADTLMSRVRTPASNDLNEFNGAEGLIIRLDRNVAYTIGPPLVLHDCVLLANGAAITCSGDNRRAPEDPYNYGIEVHNSLVADLKLDVAGNAMTGLMMFGHCQLRGHTDIRNYWGKAVGVSHGGGANATVTIDDVYCETDQATVAEAGGVQIDWGSKIGKSAIVGRVVVGPIKTKPPVALKQRWAMKIACCEHTVVSYLDAGNGGIVFGEGVGDVEIHVRNLQFSNVTHGYPSDFPRIAMMPDPSALSRGMYPRRLTLHIEDAPVPATEEVVQ